MYSSFMHLHAHSEYSLDVGFCKIDDYVRMCYENNFKASVLTERFNLYSSIKFYNACQEFDLNMILGCEMFLEYDENKNSKILLLCKNKTGYKNLLKLIAIANTDNLIEGIPILKYKWLHTINEGLLIIGLSFESDVGISLINDKIKDAKNRLDFWKKTLKNNFYISISKINLNAEKIYNERLLNLKGINKTQIVAINEVCFLRKKDFLSYKTKIAIFEQEKRTISNIEENYFKNKYFKTEKEMKKAFKNELNALYNTLDINEKCNFKFNFKNDYSPKYLKCKNTTNADFLIKLSFELLFKKILKKKIFIWHTYIERLEKEVFVITKVGFENFFLITHDFIIWAIKNDIFVGPGRGSCSGSLTAHLLTITTIDPIEYNLLFERFLNKERLSKPDFDIDFCIESRDLVLDYILDEYKFNNVSQIITFGCMTIKAVIRDLGRAMGYSYTFINKIIKLISNEIGISLKSEIVENKVLKNEYDNSYDIQKIINLSFKIEGIIKNVGKHAGGLLISPIKIINEIGLSMDDEECMTLTHLDKDDSDKLGFTKFDFLGLKTLSILSAVSEAINSYEKIYKNEFFSIEDVKKNEKKTYKLIQCGDTTGIFQLESYGVKSVIQKMKPHTFLDISALIALYRPGPLQSGMLKEFIYRKLGKKIIDYIHPRLKKVLSETYGMVVYQEQVMLIAQVFSNYDLSLADYLRIAMAKKKKEEMITHLEMFSRGALAYNVTKETSKEVFYLVEKFAGYGFNKAHSIGYAYLTYHLAWFKANYNIIFLSTLLSSDMYNQNNLFTFLDDAIHFNIKILMPDINRSFYNFTIFNKYAIRYALGAISNIGFIVIEEIINIRTTFGAFNTFIDFLKRINLELFSKKILQTIIYSGTFDKINCFRFKLVLITSKIFDTFFKNKNIKENTNIDKYFYKTIKYIEELSLYKQLEFKEFNKIYPKEINKNNLLFYKHDIKKISELSFKKGKYFNIFILGLIIDKRIKYINRKKFVKIDIQSFNKKYEIILTVERFIYFKELMKENKLLIFCCYIKKNLLKELFIENFYKFRINFIKYIDIIFDKIYIINDFIFYLTKLYKNKLIKGNTIIRFKFKYNGKYIYIKTKKCTKILIHDDILNEFNKFKEIKLELFYKF